MCLDTIISVLLFLLAFPSILPLHCNKIAPHLVAIVNSTVAAVCDDEYPRFVAFSALKDVLDEYSKVAGNSWQSASADKNASIPGTFSLS